MIKQYYKAYDALLCINTNQEGVFGDNDVFKHLTLTSDWKEPDVTLSYIESDKLSLDWDNKSTLTLKAPWNKIKNTEVMKILVSLITHRALQKKGYFMVHASAVSKGEEGLLLFGASGSGKTVTAITLCKEYGFSLISNGSSILKLENGRPVIVGTFKEGIKLRYSSFNKAFPNEAKRIFNINNDNNNALFDKKINILPKEINVNESTLINKLNTFNQIKLIEEPFSTCELDSYRTKLILYEDISRHVRGSGNIIMFGEQNNESLWIPSLDSPEIHEKRSKLIEVICDAYLGKGLYGQPDECAKFLKIEF